MTKFNAMLIKILEWLLGIMLGIAVIFIILQVFFRYVLNSPLNWTEQTSRLMFIWMMMLGTAVIFYTDSAMAFDLLLHKLPKKPRFWFEALIIVVIIAFSAYFGYHSLDLAIKVLGKYTSGVRVPSTFMYSSMFISNIFVVLVMIEKLVKHFRRKDLSQKED